MVDKNGRLLAELVQAKGGSELEREQREGTGL